MSAVYNGMNETELNEYMTSMFVGQEIHHESKLHNLAPKIYPAFGDGVITAIAARYNSNADSKLHIGVTILCGEAEHTLFRTDDISFKSDAMDYAGQLKEIETAIGEYINQKNHEEYAAAQKAYTDKVEAQKAEAEERRREERIKKAIINATIKAQQLSDLPAVSGNDQFYVTLGYLAKHGRALSARMPDTLEGWFIKEFGNQPHLVVDSNKRTVGGFAMQWNLSMTLLLDTYENMPAELKKYLTEQTDIKKVADTEFLFRLARDYGFKFGKKQNAAEIRNHVNSEHLQAFDFGFSL